MGLLEAIRFPNDYDGIIAGSPWLDPVGTSLWSLKNVKALLDPIFLCRSLRRSAPHHEQCDAADASRTDSSRIQRSARSIPMRWFPRL